MSRRAAMSKINKKYRTLAAFEQAFMPDSYRQQVFSRRSPRDIGASMARESISGRFVRINTDGRAQLGNGRKQARKAQA